MTTERPDKRCLPCIETLLPFQTVFFNSILLACPAVDAHETRVLCLLLSSLVLLVAQHAGPVRGSWMLALASRGVAHVGDDSRTIADTIVAQLLRALPNYAYAESTTVSLARGFAQLQLH